MWHRARAAYGFKPAQMIKLAFCVCALLSGRGGAAAQRCAEELEKQLQRPRPSAPYTGHPGAGNSITHRQTPCSTYTQGTNAIQALTHTSLRNQFCILGTEWSHMNRWLKLCEIRLWALTMIELITADAFDND